MTSTKTAFWNLLKRERRGALRAALGQSLLLLAACGGEAEMNAGGSTTATTSPGQSTSASAAGSTGGAAMMPAGAKPTTGAMTGTTGAMTGAKPPAMTTVTPVTAAGAAGAAGSATPSSASGAAGGTSQSPDSTASAAGAGGGKSDSTPTTGSSDGDSPLTGESSCLAEVTEFDKEGPFEVEMAREGSVNFWVPKVPAGCKVPIIHLANGTGASCSSYGQALQRFGTHGFLTCCYENANTGAGTQGLEAFMTALSKYPDLAAKRFGSTGHSQGGQAAFVVQSLAEKEFGLDGNKFAGLAMQPASGFGSQPAGGWQMQYMTIKSPMFMFSGQGSDGLVSQGWVLDAFNTLDKSIEAYFWAKAGGMHIPTPQGEEMQIGPAWFRWKLLNDKKACEYFKGIPMADTTWEEVEVQNAASCE